MTAPAPAVPRWTARDEPFWDPTTSGHRGADGAYHFFSYAAVETIATNPTLSTDWYAGVDRSTLIPVMAGLWMTDGARRRRLRTALAVPFARQAMGSLEAAVDRAVADLLTRVIDTHPQREFEVVEAVGYPLPGLIIAQILGIAPEAAEAMVRWRDEVWAQGGDLSGMAPHPEMRDHLHQVVADHRRHPAPGLLADLLDAQRRGFEPEPGQGRIEDWEIVGQLAMLLWAAVGNTSGAIADVLLFLTEAGHWNDLRADPALVAGAVEEVLRWYPSFPAIHRQATTDIVIESIAVPAGAAVVGWLTAAHQDESMFPDAATFDIRRSPNPHLAFGRGAHGCLGAHLVRAELGSVVRHAAELMPALRRTPDSDPVRRRWLEDSLDRVLMQF
jgi:cytochrome P450